MENNNKDFYQAGTQITLKDLKTGKVKEYVLLPSGNESSIIKFFEDLSKQPGLLENISEESAQAIRDASDMLNYVNKKDVHAYDQMDNLDNTPTIDDKQLILKSLSPRLKNNPTSIKLKLREKMGIGTPVHIPLWHSGIWVTLSPMKKDEKINLYLSIAKNIDTVLKKTHGLVLSQDQLLYVREIIDVIRNKIIDTNIIVPDDKDIFDYILLPDLPILVLGLLQTMYPNGVDFIIRCKNTLEYTEDEVPKCTYMEKVRLDLSKLLFTDMSKLTDENKKHMLKRASKSVTIDEVLQYQQSLSTNQTENITFTIGNDDDKLALFIELKHPTVNKYLETGEYFINSIEERVTELISKLSNDLPEDKLEEEKNNAKELIYNTLLLRTYQHYVDKITVNGTVLDSVTDIAEILDTITEDETYHEEFMKRITNMLNKDMVAIVGIPTFICPNCGAVQGNYNNNFKSFIGIDVFNYFFILLAFRSIVR